MNRPAPFALPLIFLLPLLIGCPKPSQTSQTTLPISSRPAQTAANTGAFAQTDPWILSTADLAANRGNHGIYLSNGYLGATFGAGGDAGKSGVAFVAGRYTPAETLEAAPRWHDLGLGEPKSGEPYTQTLDMKRGVLVTKRGGVTVSAFVSAVHPGIAGIEVQGMTPPAPAAISTGAARDGATGGKPWRRLYVLGKGSPEPDFDRELAAHEAEWARRWQTADIEIEGDPEAQQLAHKLLFDLWQSVQPGGADSVAPEALSGDFYKGHIFWDADVWMFPALLAQRPDLARNLLDYRLKHLPQARAIAKGEGLAGADYPWESAATGRETAPGGFSTERHVTGGVGFAAWQYYLATGDAAWLAARGYPVLSAVADHFASRAKKNAATGKYDILGVFGPDENRGKVDNNTYTNALARYCLVAAGTAARTLHKPVNPAWATVAANLTLPFDAATGAYLARAGDDGRPTKQADGELVLYPARLPMDAKTANATYDYNAPRPIKSGPAMTASMHALIAARLGRAKEAEAAFRDSYRPFVRGPFLLLSEKRSLDRCVFTTGIGGIVQSLVYGFGGVDYDRWDAAGGAGAALPVGWKSLTVRGVFYHGKRYTVRVVGGKRSVTVE